MSGNGLGSKAIQQALISAAKGTAVYEQVNGIPTENRVTTGVYCAVEFTELGPARGKSGLDATSVRMVWTMASYMGLESKDPDEIDPTVLDAVDALFAALHGDLDLGGTARNIDVLGEAGIPLSVRAGYTTVAGQKLRAAIAVVPIIINDVWSQTL